VEVEQEDLRRLADPARAGAGHRLPAARCRRARPHRVRRVRPLCDITRRTTRRGGRLVRLPWRRVTGGEAAREAAPIESGRAAEVVTPAGGCLAGCAARGNGNGGGGRRRSEGRGGGARC